MKKEDGMERLVGTPRWRPQSINHGMHTITIIVK